MDTASENRLKKVHPELAMRIATLIADFACDDKDVRVVQGLRTYAEQDALYAQGRTKPGAKVTNARGGFSNHNFGLAVDLCPFKDGKPDWNDTAMFRKIGAAAKKLGLLWGGDWKTMVDMPHVEMPGLTVAQCRTLHASGGLQAVWREASKHIPPMAKPAQPEPAKPTPAARPLLRKGDKGEHVKTLQNALIARGSAIKADGDFGPATEAAVKVFQKNNGLTADGLVGNATWNALEPLIKE